MITYLITYLSNEAALFPAISSSLQYFALLPMFCGIFWLCIQNCGLKKKIKFIEIQLGGSTEPTKSNPLFIAAIQIKTSQKTWMSSS